jgi:hypothetical protein
MASYGLDMHRVVTLAKTFADVNFKISRVGNIPQKNQFFPDGNW